MPKQLIRLPEFQWTDQTWKTEGLSNAISEYNRRREQREQFDITKGEQARQFDATNAIREQQLGLQRDQFGLQKQRADREDEDKQTQQYAAIAQQIDAEQNPQLRAGMWGKLVNSHPQFGQLLTKYGLDPKDHVQGPKFLVAQARGIQDPDKQGLVRAQTEAAEALRDERRQSTLGLQREQFNGDRPELDAAGNLVMQPRAQPASFRVPNIQGPAPDVQLTQTPGVTVDRRPTKDQERQKTIQDLDPSIKGTAREPSEAEIQRYWGAVYGQKPPSGSKYTRDGSMANVGPRNSAGGGDKTRTAIKGALASAQGGIDDAREVLRGTNMVTRGLSYMTDVGVAARVQGPVRIAIRGVLHGISGAQINIPEQQEYMDAMLPKTGDVISTIEFKLNHLETILKNIQLVEGNATPEQVLEVRNSMRKTLGMPPLSLEDAGKRLDSRGPPSSGGWKIERLR